MNREIRSILQRATHTYFAPPRNLPTSGVTDAPLCGNGDIGIAVGGTSDCIKCYLGKNDMWCSSHLGGGVKTVGTIEFDVQDMYGGEFRAWQYMDTAEIAVEVSTRSCRIRVTFCAPRGQSLVTAKIECLEGEAAVKVRLQTPGDPLADIALTKSKGGMTLTKAYTDGVEWPTSCCAVLRVTEAVNGSIQLTDGQSATALTAVATNHDREDYLQWTQAAVQASEAELSQYKKEHLSWWTEFWNESAVLLPDEPEIEKFWYASQYILACCCEKGKFAPGIFGNYITNNTANWGGDYHLNYNHQAPWWGVYSSNKVALSEPYDVPVMEYVPLARKNARKKLNCRGIYSKVGIAPKGYDFGQMVNADGSDADGPSFWGQKSNSAYAAINMIMRFYHTYDEQYTREIAYPYLTEVAEFWEDYLKWENGRYVIYNDCIHENSAAGRPYYTWVDKDLKDYSDDMNPILSLGLLRTVFKGIIDMSELLGKDEDRREKWQHIRDHLSAFPTQQRKGRNVFRYTESGMDWYDSNTLGIQHIYPAGAIGLSSGQELLELSRNTLEEMGRWRDYNGFPTFYAAAVRIGYDPDIILERMKEQLRLHGLPNLYIYYGGGGIECCSGVPGAVNEMLVQSHEGLIRFFPVWNHEKDATFKRLRTYGAFIVSGAITDGIISDIDLKSEKGRDVRILSPWPEGMAVTVNGKPESAQREESAWGPVYSFPTQSGTLYKLSRMAQ